LQSEFNLIKYQCYNNILERSLFQVHFYSKILEKEISMDFGETLKKCQKEKIIYDKESVIIERHKLFPGSI